MEVFFLLCSIHIHTEKDIMNSRTTATNPPKTIPKDTSSVLVAVTAN